MSRNWKILVISLLALLQAPSVLFAHLPQVTFQYGEKRYKLPENKEVLKIVYGRDVKKSLPMRLYNSIHDNPETKNQLSQLLKDGYTKVEFVIHYSPDGIVEESRQSTVSMPHELTPELSKLVSDEGIHEFLLAEVAKRTDKSHPFAEEETSYKAVNKTLRKDDAFHEGWVTYNRCLGDKKLSTAISKKCAKIVNPTIDNKLATIQQPTLEHHLSTPGCVSTIIWGLDNEGKKRQAINDAFRQTSYPSRTVDTFLLAYALDNPKDTERAARVFDVATNFSGTSEDIALRFGPSSIEYAFDEREAFKTRCEDCRSLGMSPTEILCSLEGPSENGIASSPVATPVATSPAAQLEETELLGIATN